MENGAVQVRAKIRNNGQITIPRAIRQALHVDKGDTVVFDVAEDGVRLRRHCQKTVQAFAGTGRIGSGKTVAQIVAELRALRDE